MDDYIMKSDPRLPQVTVSLFGCMDPEMTQDTDEPSSLLSEKELVDDQRLIGRQWVIENSTDGQGLNRWTLDDFSDAGF